MLYGVQFPMSQEAMSENFLLPIGKAKVEREGSDVTLVAHSKMVTHSLEAADLLAKEGVKAEVINLRSIRPLDIDTIKASVKKTNRYVLPSYKCRRNYLLIFPQPCHRRGWLPRIRCRLGDLRADRRERGLRLSRCPRRARHRRRHPHPRKHSPADPNQPLLT